MDYTRFGIEHVPSQQQQDVLRVIHQNPLKSIIISAVAGGSKTTTLLMASKMLSSLNPGWDSTQRPLTYAITFSKTLANELVDRVDKNVRASTIHSLGNGLLNDWCYENGVKWKYKREDNGTDKGKYRPLKADEEKYKKITWDALEKEYGGKISDGTITGEDRGDFFVSLRNINDIIEMVMLNYVGIDDYDAIQHHVRKFKLLCNENDIRTAMWCIQAGVAQFKNHGIRSFTEMVWMPLHLGLLPKITPKYIIWDEVQDASKAYMMLINLFHSIDTQIIMCGDETQSIYTFAYVPTDSYHVVKGFFEAKEIVMDWSFRCPATHTKLITMLGLKDNFNHTPWAIEGSIETIPFRRFLLKMGPGDLVLSRFNTSAECHHKLPHVAIEALKLGKRVSYHKWNIKQFLMPMVQRLMNFKKIEMHNIEKYARAWLKYATKTELGNLFPSKKKLTMYQDMFDTFILYFAHYSANSNNLSLNKFLDYIEEMHSDKHNAIKFSSIHAAKGLEAQNVFILDSQLIPQAMLSEDSTYDEIRCELHLAYVAFTRSKENLYFVDTPIPQHMPNMEQLKLMASTPKVTSL